MQGVNSVCNKHAKLDTFIAPWRPLENCKQIADRQETLNLERRMAYCYEMLPKSTSFARGR